MGAQGLGSRNTTVDLSVDPAEYFGAAPDAIENTRAWGIQPRPETDLYRVEYLFLLVFGNEDSSTDYGGIQVRASTHLWLEDGSVPFQLQNVLQRIAHRGANLFDTGREAWTYGLGNKAWGEGGYLSGFTPTENNHSYANWEVEPVGSGEARGAVPGKIEWTTEIYLEVEGTKYADLSGVGQGIGNPWQLDEERVPGDDPISGQQTWWEMSFNSAQSKYGAYDIHPPGRTASKERAKKLAGKAVFINGVKIGNMTTDGRVYLAKKYADKYDGEFSGSHSREYLKANTPATGQALATGRSIAKVDESPEAVYLETKGARRNDFDPVDPDEIDVDREVREGTAGGTVLFLSLPDPEDPTVQECRQDREVIRHLGYSDPPYSYEFATGWKWPGFRPIEEYGKVTTPEDMRDDGQAGLGGDQ